ncbi:RAB6-interacting golgin [Heracleum sosnowskyi]|uniref:RAB6-interacting golgin n=1 Tax=Heracleum sosnowskyi TaxID=360622 RepID=A0AAD8GUL3_9APIA|nr:RAB6-interacting golgin [Heracleum sosnowskyi]
MATSKEELDKENKQQIVQLASDMANISISNVKGKGTLALSVFRNREEELMKNKMEVMEKVEHHLRLVEEEAEIWNDTESPDQMKKEIDSLSKKYESLVLNCTKKEKEYKESIEALESYGQFIESCFEFNNETAEPTETKLLETRSEGEVTDDDDHSEKELEALQEKNEVIPLNSEAEEAEESQFISLNSEAENEKEIENAETVDRPKVDGRRRSKRTVKVPFWMKDYVTGKGKK